MATPTSITSAIAGGAAATVSSGAAKLTTITPTIVATAGQAITTTISVALAPAKAPPQSILDHGAPAPNHYDPGNPLRLFIIQVSIIVALCRLVALVLARLRQPKVISEVIAGLILGPSVMGRIPGFTQNIFPPQSLPNLNLVANIGLTLFLFLVGLEADLSVFKRNAKAAICISFFGLAVPFGLGAAISVGIYNNFVDTDKVDFGVFLLFIGTAMAITAFPVLARILTELKMLQNPVGLTTLAAGVGNDVVGWILLALSVALANAGDGVSAVYILLTMVGICLFLYFIIKPLFIWALRRSGSYDREPTYGILTLIFFITFATAFLTDIIGVHAIFGSFLVGFIVVPHNKGIATAITEKMEDLISILFIPIYFCLSGLKTDLGLLNNGSIWGWVVAVIVVAFFSKFLSCAAVAKLFGNPWRESLAIGSLMACKGLVELIVLNIGLNAGILNKEVFAMFVVMALVTTFLTTPLCLTFYPESYWRPKMLASIVGLGDGGHGRVDSDGKTTLKGESSAKDEEYFRRRFLVVLERLDSLPSMMSFVKLLQPTSLASTPRLTMPMEGTSESGRDTDSSENSNVEGKTGEETRSIEKLDKIRSMPSSSALSNGDADSRSSILVDAYRLLELTERTSALMRASEEMEVTKKSDSILNIFSSFASMMNIRLTTSMSIVPHEEFPQTIINRSNQIHSDMVVIPWSSGTALGSDNDPSSGYTTGNPLESLFGKNSSVIIERSPQYANFVRKIFLEAANDVGLFLDAGVSMADGAIGGSHQHLFLPFHGGPDDRSALHLVMQLVASNGHTSATIIRVVKVAPSNENASRTSDVGSKQPTDDRAGPSSPTVAAGLHQLTLGSGLGGQDTVYAGVHSTQHRLASDTADNVALARYFPMAVSGGALQEDNVVTPALAHALDRVDFRVIETSTPLKTTLDHLDTLSAVHKRSVLSIVGRSRHSAPTHRVELEAYLKEKVLAPAPGSGGNAPGGIQNLGIAGSSEVRKTLGDIGSALVVSGKATSVLVLQSAVPGEKSRKAKDV